ncbi:MAG: GntR family transcriptional regulator [Candidatus Nanopelagicales bacterium]
MAEFTRTGTAIRAGSSILAEGPISKHAQLRSILLKQIESTWAPHTAIPSERELMAEYAVSRATVREAIRQLVEEGKLYRVHGKGTFVAGERIQATLHLASFTDDMRRRGLVAATIVRRVALVEAPVEARAALGLAAAARVWDVERLRMAGGIPMALERGFYPEALLPGLDRHDLTRSLYTTLSTAYRLPIDRAEQTVWAELADAPVGEALGVAQGAPLLVFRRSSAAGAQPVEYVTSWYRGDRYQIHMFLEGGS